MSDFTLSPRLSAPHLRDMPPNLALFLDFDGTLAPLQDDADSVQLPNGVDAVIIRLAAKLDGALALISGRGLTDLSSRSPMEVWRFGNHGLFAAAPGAPADPAELNTPPPADLGEALESVQRRHDGVRLEYKGPVIAVHYRANPGIEADLKSALDEALSAISGYKLQHGKFVSEAKPAAANKGQRLSEAMTTPPFLGKSPVMIGDDTTDEDAFRAAQAAGGKAIKVGPGPTGADYRLPDVPAVAEFLRSLL